MPEGPHLIRALGRFDLTAFVINRVIGAGVFGVPAVLFAQVGVMSIAAVTLAALVVLAIALCFAEIGSRFRDSGGPYLYALRTFGPAAGFEVGWLLWVTQIGGFAAVANLLVNYLGWFVPSVMAGGTRAVIITALVVALTTVNIRGVRRAAVVGNILTVGKVVPLVLFVVVGAFFVDWSAFTPQALQPSQPLPPLHALSIAPAVLIAIYPFSGFEVMGVLSGEVREPEKDIPFGLLAGLLIVAAIYVGVQVVAIGTLPALATSTRPLADAAGHVLGRTAAIVMVAGALVSTLGVLHAMTLAAGRVPFAMAEQRQLPAALGTVHPVFRTPWVGLLLSGACMLLFTLATTFVSALTITVGLRVLIYIITCAALPALRRRRTGSLPPPAFWLPAGEWVAALCVVTCIGLLAVRPWAETLQLLAVLLLGVLLWAGTAARMRAAVPVLLILAGCGGDSDPTPDPDDDAVLEIVSGNSQIGLAGRALADSLVVRARTEDGAAVSGATITWATAGGSASTATSTTDAAGLARVQWRVGAGAVTLTASSTGATPATFSATGRASGSCTLTRPPGQRMSLGPTDFTLSLNAAQPVRAVVLFADFPGTVASETPAALMASVVTPGISRLAELSYGRLDITATPVNQWFRMSQAIGAYDWRTFAGHKAYLQEIMTLANATVDFSAYNLVYVFTPPSAAQVVSPTFNGGQSDGLAFDGVIIGNAVTFGNDTRSFGASVVAHETGHVLGLVDLYRYDPSPAGTYQGNQFRDVGAWSLMSNIFVPAHWLAWEKRKLGFVDADQVDCLDAEGGVEAVLQPVAGTGGTKMVALPLDASRALVIEARNAQGLDANLCDQGVLIYEVNAAIEGGLAPATLRPSRTTTSGPLFAQCGPWPDAAYAVGAGEIDTYTDAPSGISVRVLGAEAGGAIRVQREA